LGSNAVSWPCSHLRGSAGTGSSGRAPSPKRLSAMLVSAMIYRLIMSCLHTPHLSQEFVRIHVNVFLASVSCNWTRKLCDWDFAAPQYDSANNTKEDADLAFDKRKVRSMTKLFLPIALIATLATPAFADEKPVEKHFSRD